MLKHKKLEFLDDVSSILRDITRVQCKEQLLIRQVLLECDFKFVSKERLFDPIVRCYTNKGEVINLSVKSVSMEENQDVNFELVDSNNSPFKIESMDNIIAGDLASLAIAIITQIQK